MRKLALLFPGQGSQESGMGRALAEASSEAMDLWKKAERISGLPLREIYWEGDEAAMADTRALQPALTVVNLTCWQSLAPHIAPGGTAGHSLGEYSALTAAGVLSPEEVLEMTALRGRLMADADPDGRGAMAALVKLNRDAAEDIVRQTVEATGEILLIANYNTPAQFVVSGAKNAVEQAMASAKERKGRAIALKVSGAFHSPLMAEAAQELLPVLRKATWRRPRIPVYCNVTGRSLNDGESLKECMLRQMTSSVLWIDTIANQWRDGMRAWLEVGPKSVLTKMVRPCLDAVPVPSDADIKAVHADGPEAFRSLMKI